MLWDLVDPDVVLVTDPSWPGGGEFRGSEQYQWFMTQFLEAFEGIRFQPESEPEAIGEAALFHGRWVGLGAASGAETTSMPFWVAVRSSQGRVTEAGFFFDEEKAREALSPT